MTRYKSKDADQERILPARDTGLPRRFDTDRLILREFRLEDIYDLHEYSVNPNIGPNAGWPAHDNLGQSRSALCHNINVSDVWAIELADENKVVGSIGLHADRLWEKASVRMLGYVLSEPYWGHGYATEAARRIIRYAFEEAGFSLLTIYHYSFNSRSSRVVRKCGFVYEGTYRNCTTLTDGNLTDEICYSMTRYDYESLSLSVSP